MELKRAKEVLEGMCISTHGGDTIESHQKDYTVTVKKMRDFTHVYIRGKISDEQVIAIATWMRDPEGVVKA